MFNVWPGGPAAKLHKLKRPGLAVKSNELYLNAALPESAQPGLNMAGFK